jgi:hypothetical protein
MTPASECDEDRWQYEFRAMSDMQRVDMMCWMCEQFPELLSVVMAVEKNIVKEV